MESWIPEGEMSSNDVLVGLASLPAVWARWSLLEHDGTWRVHHGELVAGEAPSTWAPVTWEYPGCIFVADEVPGDTLAQWLRSDVVQVAGRSATAGGLQDRVRWSRQASHEGGGSEALPWPSAAARTTGTVVHIPPPTDHLVSDDGPAFLSYAAAASAFFRGPPSPGGMVANDVVLRVQDRSGRLTGIRIGDEVHVSVGGDDLDAMVVHLAGAVPGARHRLEQTPEQQVVFPLPGGLPAQSWVVLSRGTRWVDRRFLSVSYTRGAEHGVEFVVEPQTKLAAYLAQREDDALEFKVRVPSGSDTRSVLRVMKTVCAFANGDGGTILFGVDDEGDAVGLPAGHVRTLIDSVSNLVDSWVSPRPKTDFDVLPVDDTGAQVVLELVVSGGTDLYGAGRPSEHPRVYIRHNGRSVPARPAEIESLVRSKTPMPATGPFAPRLL